MPLAGHWPYSQSSPPLASGGRTDTPLIDINNKKIYQKTLTKKPHKKNNKIYQLNHHLKQRSSPLDLGVPVGHTLAEALQGQICTRCQHR